MPGIAGIFASLPSPAWERQSRRMLAALDHSPGCVSGMVSAPELGVYGGWVAHEGSFAARQSMAAGPRRTRVLFCGECFDAGQASDATLSARYEIEGDALVPALNGMFAGLLLDRDRRLALLFNDRYGGERLYVSEDEGTLYFASEAKALLSVLPRLRAFDDTGVAQFLGLGTTLGERTLFRGIARVAGGSLWRLVPGSAPRKTRYFDPGAWEEQPALEGREWETHFERTFRRVLPGYVQCDRRVGLSLTGGLDTRMVLACLDRDVAPGVTYTYAAAHRDTLDVKIARRVAAVRELPHHALRIGPQFLRDYGRHVDRTVFVTDGSGGALNAHEIHLSEMARALAPVRLTGNYGSEILRGMSTFKPLGLDTQVLEPALATRLNRQLEEHRARPVHPLTRAAFEEIPWRLFGTWSAARSLLTVRTPYMDNELVKLAYRAPDALRRSPEAALRLIRAADPALAAIATDRGLRAPAGRRGPWAARLFCALTFKLDYWYEEGMPDSLSRLDPLWGQPPWSGLLGLHKFLAYRRWFRAELAPYLAEVVNDSHTRTMPFWSPVHLHALVADHASGRRNRTREIGAVLTLEAVQRTLLSPAVHDADADTRLRTCAAIDAPMDERICGP